MKLEKSILDAFEQAKSAQSKAHAPYSNYKVGTALKLQEHDEIFIGCNTENASLGATVCAERNAIAASVAQYGKSSFEFLVLVTNQADPAPPCGMCLQVLCEFVPAEFPIYLANLQGIQKQVQLKDLLPLSFTKF